MEPFSQQDIYEKKPTLKRLITYPLAKETSIPKGFISEDKAAITRQIFEANKQRYIEEILQKIQNLKDRQAIYYYFIGRLNPPHEGHIQALLSVITNALEHRGKAIILLGSGPNGGMRTSKDPLDFNLKKKFVVYKLKEELLKINPQLNIESLFAPNGQVEILEMGRPVSQIQGVIEDDMQNLLDTLNEIYTFRVSGDKDGGEDLAKLAWIEKGLKNARIINEHGVIIPITAQVIAQPAVIIESEDSDESPEALSATTIRNIVYNMDPTLPDKIENFRLQTINFYGDFTPEIFNAIDKYNPNTKRSKKSKIETENGGSRKSKRRKHKLTKRRKSKRVTKYKKSKRRR